MTNDITFGKYIPKQTLIHQLDPRTKLISITTFIFILFINQSITVYVANAILLVILFYLAKIPMIDVLKSLKAVGLLLFFTLIFRMIITVGEPLIIIGPIVISNEGVIIAVQLTMRIALMILAASLLSFTTSPKDLSDGLERLFSFLRRFGVSTSDISIVVMIAFRFIPIIQEEVENIQNAQISRGADYQDAGIIRKSQNMATLVVPLFLSVVQRAANLANAIDSRGYDSNIQRTRLRPLRYQKNDKIVFLLTMFLIGVNFLVIIVR